MDNLQLTESEAKTMFARELLKHPNAYLVAAGIFWPNTPPGLDQEIDIQRNKIAVTWAKDPFVLSEIIRLKEEEGEESFLPTRADICRQIYERAERQQDDSIFVELIELAAKVRGHIAKPGTVIDNRQVHVTNVLEVPTHGNDDDWERTAVEQQRKLIEAGNNTVN